MFQIMLENAVRTCEAEFGDSLSLRRGWLPGRGDAQRATRICRGTCIGRPSSPGYQPLARSKQKQVAQIADVTTSQGYVERDPFVVTAVALGGYRTVLSVPMLKENELIGVISIYRQEVRPFDLAPKSRLG